MTKERNKLIASICCVVVTFATTFYSLKNVDFYKNSNVYKEEVETLKKPTINKKEGIVVKSDGKEVAVLESEQDIKRLLDKIKKQYINSSSVKDIGEIKLNNKITYYKTDVSMDELKGVEYYASSIINGHDDISAISFTIKGKEPEKSAPILSRGTISSNFGQRWGKMHNGIDIAASLGTPIHCVLPGKVIYSGWEDGYGNVVKIENENNVVTIYGHCNKLFVKKGVYVEKGEKIGEVGSTGRSTGPHLHFEVRKNGTPQDPQDYLN